MSFTELQTGKLKRISEMTPEGVENYCKEQCKEISPKKYEDVIANGFKSYESSWLEVVNDALWNLNDCRRNDSFIYENGVLYKVHDVKNHEDESFFFHMEQIGDGEYQFITKYYNGGTCLSEILSEEINNI